MNKEAMNLKANQEGHMGGKGNDVIILQSQEIK